MKKLLIKIILTILFILSFLYSNNSVVFQKANYKVHIRNKVYTPEEWISKKHWDKFEKITKIIYLKGYFSGWEDGNRFAQARAQDIDRSPDGEMSIIGDKARMKLENDKSNVEKESIITQYDLDEIINKIDKIYLQDKYKDVPLEKIISILLESKNEKELDKNLNSFLHVFNEPPEGPEN